MGLWTKIAVGAVVVAAGVAAAIYALGLYDTTQPHLQSVAKSGTDAAPATSGSKLNWQVTCGGDRGDLRCSATQSVSSQKAGRVSAVIQIGRRSKQPVLLLQLPLNISLPEAVRVRIGSEPAKTLKVRMCVREGCEAASPLTANEISALVKGEKLTVSLKDRSKKDVTFQISGSGFDKAYARLN